MGKLGLKYYAMNCLDKAAKKLPLYFPLRKLEFDPDDQPVSFPVNLVKWAERYLLNITGEEFLKWLQDEETLILLDGLDEISSKERRRKVCRWIETMCTGLDNACFVVTSRATGYRKLDGIELEVPHLRADIMDFSPQQQEVFLRKWFRAVFFNELPPVGSGIPDLEWKRQQEILADQRSKTIIDFLNQEDNKAVRELAAVPMLLQIMAIIWKDHQHLPESRFELYDAALNYLLDYRDRRRKLKPLLRAEKARRVLAPAALWMQEKLKKDEAAKIQMHEFMQPYLDKLKEQPSAAGFCENLRDRAGLILDYDKNHYIFRHKSFREFLAGFQLKEEAHEETRVKMLVDNFKEDWWEETLRFFMGRADDEIFDKFMRYLFQSPVSRHLDDNKQNFLQNLVNDATLKTIDGLVECLNSRRLNNNQKRYVMDCLKAIDTPGAIDAIDKADKSKMDKGTHSYAEDIVAAASEKDKKEFLIGSLPSFRNSFEDKVEYIKIPGGTYTYSVTGKKEIVPDLYFCKYPVTNKRYRRFISYLAGRETDLLKMLPLNIFAKKLLEFSKSIRGCIGYLGKNHGKWPEKLRSRFDDDKKFNGDDQPVVRVSWYGARAYCFWLSCLESALKEERVLYRLPTEIEWEWAAGGGPDGSVREYPWPAAKGEPNPKLANYANNVGATTPVGRYPEGATPSGLMDMAGNVWEWMENYYDEDEDCFALRGGSWFFVVTGLRCSARLDLIPGYYLHDSAGFRPVRSRS